MRFGEKVGLAFEYSDTGVCAFTDSIRILSVAKWSALNGFNPRYVQVVIQGKRGSWGAGKAKKIFAALVNQGLMTDEEAAARVKP